MTLEEKKQVEELLLKRHKRKLRKQESISLIHDDDGVKETLIFAVRHRAEVFRFEAQVQKKDVKPRNASTELLMDFLDGVLEEWLATEREAYPPLDFAPYEFEDVTILLRGGLERPELEEEADRLLGND